MLKGTITVADADPAKLSFKINIWKKFITDQGGTYKLGVHRWMPDPLDRNPKPRLIEGVTIHIK